MFFYEQQSILLAETGGGRNKREVDGDEEGMEIMYQFGENIAWLLEKLNP